MVPFHPRADMLGLLLHLLHQPGALDDLGEAGIILDVGGDGELAAGLDALDDDRRQAGAGGVDGGAEPGRAGAEDDHSGAVGRGHHRDVRGGSAAAQCRFCFYPQALIEAAPIPPLQPEDSPCPTRKPDRPRRLRVRRVHQPGSRRACADLFVKLGFTHVGNHRSKNVRHYAQGDINFILNMERAGQPADFREAHGPSANGMAFRVGNAPEALALALERGAERGRDGARPRRARHSGDRGDWRLLPLSRRPLRRREDLRHGFRAGARRRPRRQQRRPAHARPSHPQCEPGADGSLGEFLREDLQLPPDPLFRHRGQADRPAVAGDDRARRQDPHPAQREPGRLQPDRRISEGI